MRDKFRGALIGLAAGDALGATTEFMSKDEVEYTYDHLDQIIGGGWLKLKPGEVTDDTEMTLCVANGIVEDYKKPLPAIGKEFIKWMATKPKDVGISTANSIKNFKGDWLAASKKSHEAVGKSAGNGSLMRCLPIALAYSDRKVIEQLSFNQSKMTHYDDEAAEACVIYNNIARSIIEGTDLKSAIKQEIKGTIYEKAISGKLNSVPDGYVVNTFNWVLKTLNETDNYSSVIETLANLGEDSDTTAAIAGGLAGLHYGYDAIDDKYKNKILISDEILKIADKLYELREGSE